MSHDSFTRPFIDKDYTTYPTEGYTGKRLFDIVVATVLLLPALVIIAVGLLAVYLDTGRPFFFFQTRVTSGWRHFTIWKIRTMDERENVTRVGRILRLTCVDELPQLLQVLSGTMSIVGPRPHKLDHAAKLQQINPAYMRLLDWKPGLLSPVCIRGKWEELRRDNPSFDPVRVNLDFFEGAGAREDFALVMQGVRKVFEGVKSCFD